MTFGNRIKTLRSERKLTQKELADSLSLGESTISFYESDKREPDYDTLKKIADFFEVSVDYLMGRTDDPLDNKGYTIAAHRSDNPWDDLPEEAVQELNNFEAYIRNKYNTPKK